MSKPTPEQMKEITAMLEKLHPGKKVVMANPWKRRAYRWWALTKHKMGIHSYINVQSYDAGRGSIKYEGLICMVCQNKGG